ncbi:MAG: nucleotide sugar dehydrogenase [bacterium]|nr:nucleotide sugar dehydrogenase [bacterium]
MEKLKQKIKNKEAKIVVVGLGYVGLPVACLLAKAGFAVKGIDLNKEKITLINKGVSPLDTVEEGIGQLVEETVKNKKLLATDDYAVSKEADVVIVCVETPVEEVDHLPAYKALRSALSSVGENLQKGSLVIVESTIAPGTTKQIVIPTLEEKSGMKLEVDFFVGHCPERLMPTRIFAQLKTYPRVVGGTSPKTAEAMTELYRNITSGDLDLVDPLTAEVTKTEENSFGDALIAQANAFALLCQSYGVDANQIIKLIRKIPGYWGAYLNPGPGVGGHCLPKDPYLKIMQLKASPGESRAKELVANLVNLNRAINDYMPENMTVLIEEALAQATIDPKKAKVALLGFAYKANTDDTRNSPTEALVECLQGRVAEIKIHDPFVQNYQGKLEETLKGVDVLVLMVKHDVYKEIDLAETKALLNKPVIVDAWAFFDKEKVKKAGFIYKGVGNVG